MGAIPVATEPRTAFSFRQLMAFVAVPLGGRQVRSRMRGRERGRFEQDD